MTPDRLPNYHFLLIAPNLGAEWLFDAARLYWERFRPTIVSDFELVRLVPPDYTVTVTVITRRDMLPSLGVTLAQVAPQALFDPLAYDFFDDAKLALDGRAHLNQPFGVPLLPTDVPTPSPTFLPNDTLAPGESRAPIEATAGALPTEGPSPTPTSPGFITQTPTPDTRNAPTEEPAATSTPQQPIYPTPGPVTGA